MSLLGDFYSLIYPSVCVVCGNSLWKSEQIVCSFCNFRLPKTNFHLEQENPFIQLFWGRVRIEHATAFLFFNKGNSVQQLVHALKYHGRKDVGVWTGIQFGVQLKDSPFYGDIDCIIPVPLHPDKITKRGYNQSELFAKGLSQSLGLPINNQTLIRKKSSESQTKKTRFHRWENVDAIFGLIEQNCLQNKHILLVDDVVTTGATLEACIHYLSQVPGIRISLATIAFANK